MTPDWDELKRKDTALAMRLAKQGVFEVFKDWRPIEGRGAFKGRVLESWTLTSDSREWAGEVLVVDWMGDRHTVVHIERGRGMYSQRLHFDNKRVIEFAKIVGFAHELPGPTQVLNLYGDDFVDALMDMEPEDIESVFGAA